MPTPAAARPPVSRTRTRTRAASSSRPDNSGSTWTADTTVGGRDLNFVTFINPGFAPSGTFVSSLKDANPAAGPHAELDDAHASRRPRPPAPTSSSRSPPATARAARSTSSGPTARRHVLHASGASLSQFNGFRYLKYKAILTTTNGAVTPSLSSVQVCFTDVAATSATSLAAAPATGTFGGTTTLSATLTSGGSGVSGKIGRVHAQRQQCRQRQHERQRRRHDQRRQPRRDQRGLVPDRRRRFVRGRRLVRPEQRLGLADRQQGRPDDQRHARTLRRPRSSTPASRSPRPAAAPATPSRSRARGACSNTGATFTMTSGTGTCSVKLRPGRQLELQRRPAGDRDHQRPRRRTRRST